MADSFGWEPQGPNDKPVIQATVYGDPPGGPELTLTFTGGKTVKTYGWSLKVCEPSYQLLMDCPVIGGNHEPGW